MKRRQYYVPIKTLVPENLTFQKKIGSKKNSIRVTNMYSTDGHFYLKVRGYSIFFIYILKIKVRIAGGKKSRNESKKIMSENKGDRRKMNDVAEKIVKQNGRLLFHEKNP